MTNEEKANEIVSSIIEDNPYGDQTPRKQALKSTLVMAEWKDKQYAPIIAKYIEENAKLMEEVVSLRP